MTEKKKNVAAREAAVQGAKAAENRIAEEAKKKFTRIDSFDGIYEFLSLEISCPVLFNGVMHYSAKHAILAAQYPDATDFLQAPGNSDLSVALKQVEGETEAKEWSQNRLKAMERVQRDKFQRSEEYRKKLKETGDRDLVWENDSDTFWGATKGRGQNHLGRILMELRSSIQEDTDFHSWLFLCCDLESDSVRWPPVELIESKDDGSGETQVHRLTGKEYYKLGKLPSNAVAALHPSISREHALILHTKMEVARATGGVAIMDLGSKFGTHLDGRRLANGFVMEPLKNGAKLKLGASTRSYEVRVNLRSQIEELERQQRELMREVQSIDQDAADPVQAAKRLAKEEATCFVGGLEYDTEKADLLGLFQDCGHVEEVRFPGQQEVGGKAVKGIAFVVFDSAMAARRACGLSGEMFKGRKLKVAPATDRPKGGGKGEGKGKKGDGDAREEDPRGGSRQFLRDMLDGKWERGVALPDLSPERRKPPPRRRASPPPRELLPPSPSPVRSPPRERSRSRSASARSAAPRKRKDKGKGKDKRKGKKRKKSSSSSSSSSSGRA